MGVSTDAVLAYGYVWEDEFDLLADDESEWEEVIAAQRGISDPWAAYPHAELNQLGYDERQARSKEWMDAHRAELDAWYAAKKGISEEYGVEVDRHGSDEWSVPVVKITGAGHTAARGYPHKLTAEDLAVDPSWDGKLQRFVADLHIDVSEAKGPGWFLMSWWGG